MSQRCSNTSARAGINPPQQKVGRRRKVLSHNPLLTKAVWKTTDHDYVATRRDPDPPTEIELLKNKMLELEDENRNLKMRALCLQSVKENDDMFQFYTNLPNYAVFQSVSDYLKERSGDGLKYWRGADTTKYEHFNGKRMERSKPGPDRKLAFEEEFFMVLVRCKTGCSSKDLAIRFGIDETLVSRVLSTWVNFLDIELKMLFEMKDDEENVANCYKDMPDLKVVIDCTEQQCEKSSNLQARKETFSNYKQRDTLKWLIGLSRNLTVNYVSSSYGGRASDKFITLDSDALLVNLQPGSSVMGDRGFLVGEELTKLGVKLILPDYKGRNRSQMTRRECEGSEFISIARIHIGRFVYF